MKVVCILFLASLLWFGCSASAEQLDRTEGAPVVDERRDAELVFTEINRGFRDASAIDFTAGDERIYIVESGRNRLITLDTGGNRTDSVGSRGSGDSRFDRPSDIDATNGMRIYVADLQNNRVQLFDRRLAYLSTIKPPSDRQGVNPAFFSPAAVSVNAFDEIYVYDSDSETILKFDRNGRLQSLITLNSYDIELPLRALLAHEDQLFVLEAERGLIHELSSGGGYRGFTAGAPDVKAMYLKNRRIWALSSDSLYIISLSGRIEHTVSHNLTGPIRGVAVSRNRVYGLIPDALSAAVFRFDP